LVTLVVSTDDPLEEYEGADFSITTTPSFPVTIPGQDAFQVDVTFSPTSGESFNVFMYIFTPSGDPPTIFVPLSGTGADPSANILDLKLMGIEIVKGIDIGDIRYGTMFMGKVFESSIHVGNWYTVIRHKDTENIEVCGKTNNLLKVKLVVNLNEGSLAGNRLVLGLSDFVNEEEVVWDAMAPICGPACYDEDCVCPSKPDLIKPWNCAMPLPEDYGPVATIENLELIQKFGTTLDIEGAFLTGWLCHNWAFIPRVTASLTVVLED
jgi:hypothetical protein